MLEISGDADAGAEVARLKLIEEIAKFSDVDGVHATPVPRLSFIRRSHPTEPMHAVHKPALCMIVQGTKQVVVGEKVFNYDASRHLVVSLDVPVIGQVVAATPEAPYLCVKLDLDPAVIGSVLLESRVAPQAVNPACKCLGLSRTTPDLFDAMTRLASLARAPQDIAYLAPLIEREIIYRLLSGEQAAQLRQIAIAESRLEQVGRAVELLRERFAEAVRMDDLANAAGMSASSFFQHFKQVTAMSPLQYQKRLRLQHARKLILTLGYDAAAAGHEVGYDSPSQFSREYARLFGAPPLKDIARLKAAGETLLDT
ncbi:AraC family transcriptional regulator [Pelagibacterium xiamenense]|uniref:AraC family transcriptional regulator n=1 Tax=Pelagibacterium xiamenense TaxID=2901140 RepID=UPI001E39735A|nr:AraC family transcriptional regulator [Pelagibacterium xiamenense]MCD7058850.1 AraC family transcriptional regulator [Pelagibacterium xiamenense]